MAAVTEADPSLVTVVTIDQLCSVDRVVAGRPDIDRRANGDDEVACTRCRCSSKDDVVVVNRKAFRRLTGAAVWLLNYTVDADQHLLGVGASVAEGEPIGCCR